MPEMTTIDDPQLSASESHDDGPEPTLAEERYQWHWDQFRSLCKANAELGNVLVEFMVRCTELQAKVDRQTDICRRIAAVVRHCRSFMKGRRIQVDDLRQALTERDAEIEQLKAELAEARAALAEQVLLQDDTAQPTVITCEFPPGYVVLSDGDDCPTGRDDTLPSSDQFPVFRPERVRDSKGRCLQCGASANEIHDRDCPHSDGVE